jgi:ankyrin repeat protein
MYQFITCRPLVNNFLKNGRFSFRGENGFSEFLSGSQGMTELHVAAIIGHGRLVDLVLSHSPHLIDRIDQERNG